MRQGAGSLTEVTDERTLVGSARGFTLVEVMVAMLIMMVGLVGLLQSVWVAIEQNLRNELREGAVYLGEKYMNELRGKTFACYSATYTAFSVPCQFGGGRGSYRVARSATDLSIDGSTKQLQVTVTWAVRNVSYQNRVVSTVSQGTP